MIAKMIAEESSNGFLVRITFSGEGWGKGDYDAVREKYADAEKLGMRWDRVEYVAEIPATPEDAEPFQQYAEEKGIKLVLG